MEPIPERASLPVPANPIPVLFIGDVGPAIRDRDPVERSNALLRTQSHAKDSQLVSGSSVFIALDFTSATPLRTKAYVGTPLVTRCIPLYTIIIGTHTNTRTTYIGTQALVETLFFLQLDLLVFLLLAGSQAFLLPFSMPLPQLSSLVPPPLLVVSPTYAWGSSPYG